MKVRNKFLNKTQEYEVIEESPSYYIVQARPNSLERWIFNKCDMEIIPEQDRWQDVTGECELTGENTTIKYHGLNIVGSLHGGYSLRKVRFADCSKHGTSEYQYRDAFIIERKL